MRNSWGKVKRPLGISIIAVLLLFRAVVASFAQIDPTLGGLPDAFVLSAILGFRFDLWVEGLTIVLSLVAAVGLWLLKLWAWYLTMLILVIGILFAMLHQQWLYAAVQFVALVYMLRSRITAIFGLGSF